MVPKVPKTGRNFFGAWAYYAHDKRSDEQKAQNETLMSSGRVAWMHSENLAGLDAGFLTVQLMKKTAKLNTRCEQPVYAFSLAWHPEENPDKDHMIEAGNAALKALGMDEHQALFIAHRDRHHSHVHIMVNRIHPQTLKAKNNFQDFKRLSDWAGEYEREHGKIYCAARQAAGQDSAKDKAKRYADNTILEAWSRSDSGKGFQAALEAKGWKLGLGDRKDRFMALAPSGKPLDILREINKTREKGEKLKAADIECRFADLKHDHLKRIADLQAAREAARGKQKRLEAIKREASREFFAAENAERQRLENLHRVLQEKHSGQQRHHEEQAAKMREEAERSVRETYRIDEKLHSLKAAQKRLKAKWTFWSIITGRHKRQKKQAAQEIRELRRAITEGRNLAKQYRQHIETLIRQQADALSIRQHQERQALPPVPAVMAAPSCDPQNGERGGTCPKLAACQYPARSIHPRKDRGFPC